MKSFLQQQLTSTWGRGVGCYKEVPSTDSAEEKDALYRAAQQ